MSEIMFNRFTDGFLVKDDFRILTFASEEAVNVIDRGDDFDKNLDRLEETIENNGGILWKNTEKFNSGRLTFIIPEEELIALI